MIEHDCLCNLMRPTVYHAYEMMPSAKNVHSVRLGETHPLLSLILKNDITTFISQPHKIVKCRNFSFPIQDTPLKMQICPAVRYSKSRRSHAIRYPVVPFTRAARDHPTTCSYKVRPARNRASYSNFLLRHLR